MKCLSNNTSRAARQILGKQLLSLRLFMIALTGCSVLFTACNEKTNSQAAKTEAKSEAKKDSLSNPRSDIRVNRHYDDKGNLLGFDSTYTSFYSNVEGDTATMHRMMKGFDDYFSLRHPSLLQQEFEPLFFNDSSRYPDFFHHDYFMKRYELNDAYMRGMMLRMDSIKNRYFEEHSKPPKQSSRR